MTEKPGWFQTWGEFWIVIVSICVIFVFIGAVIRLM